MIEEVLMDYGMLGLLVFCMISAIIYLAKRDEIRDKIILEVVKNNTIALTRFVDQRKKCEK